MFLIGGVIFSSGLSFSQFNCQGSRVGRLFRVDEFYRQSCGAFRPNLTGSPNFKTSGRRCAMASPGTSLSTIRTSTRASVEVSFILDGRPGCLDFSSAADVPFESCAPVRDGWAASAEQEMLHPTRFLRRRLHPACLPTPTPRRQRYAEHFRRQILTRFAAGTITRQVSAGMITTNAWGWSAGHVKAWIRIESTRCVRCLKREGFIAQLRCSGAPGQVT